MIKAKRNAYSAEVTMTFDEKKERWDFIDSLGLNPYEHVSAVNAFCWSDSPLNDFKYRVDRFKVHYQHDFFFSGYESIWDYMRFEHGSIWSNFCEDLAFCIDLCSRFGDLEKAMELLRYQEENNLRSEQPSMRL